MRTETETYGDGMTVNIQVPDSLDEIAQFIESKPADEVVDMSRRSVCLGAQLLRHLNPTASSVSFGVTDGEVTMEAHDFFEDRTVDFVLDGAVWGFFDFLFRRGGASSHQVEGLVQVPAYTCICGDPACLGNRPATEVPVRQTTFGTLVSALRDYRALGEGEDMLALADHAASRRYRDDQRDFAEERDEEYEDDDRFDYNDEDADDADDDDE